LKINKDTAKLIALSITPSMSLSFTLVVHPDLGLGLGRADLS
jgi:hypothetical protein